MSAFYALYTTLLIIALLTCLALAIYGWRHRQQQGARFFFWWMLSALGWSTGALLALTASTPAEVHFWDNQVKITFVTVLPVFYLLFALDYTNRQKWLRPPFMATLFAIPLIVNWVNWTPFPPYLFIDLTYELRSGYIYLTESSTNWFWFHTYYSYGLILVSTIMLVVQAIRSRQPYRGQALLLSAGIIPPILTNYVTIFQPFEVPSYEWTAIAFAATGLIWFWALFRYRLLDVMPIARDSLVESMDDAVLVLDPQNRVLDINPAAEQLLHLTETAVIGQSIQRIIPDEEQNLYQRFANVSEGQAEIEIGQGSEKRYFDLRITQLQRNSLTIGRLIVLRDMTEQAKLLQELDAYAHTVAHDLKNPLTGITGYLDLALEDLAEPEIDRDELESLLHSAQSSSHKLFKVIDSLLLLASVRRQQDIPFKQLDLGLVVQDCLDRFQLQIADAGAELVVAPSWPLVVGYRPWIEEVLANYLSNALKYGGVPPRIVITAEPAASNMVRVLVTDNGAGLTEEEQGRLFVPFSRLEPTRATGYGLGLSIAQRIVTRLAGEVGIESKVGEGSTFWFTLPAPDDEAHENRTTAVFAQM